MLEVASKKGETIIDVESERPICFDAILKGKLKVTDEEIGYKLIGLTDNRCV